jgi:hypothetical protein
MGVNTLTALIPSFYVGLNQVSQEQTDLIDAVNMNSKLESAYVGQTITYPIAPVATTDNVDYAAVPSFAGQTAGSGTLSISKSKNAGIVYNGDEIRQLQLTGTYSNYYADQMAQAVRALRKLVSADIAAAGIAGACRAVGTAGTTPFGTAGDLTDFAACNKMFNQNGSPAGGLARRLILNNDSVYNIQGKQSVLFKANEAGTDKLLRTGEIGSVSGLAVGLDEMLTAVTTTMDANDVPILTGALVAGATAIVLTVNSCSSPMAHTPVAGDRFYIGTDTQFVYVVKAYTATTITIAAPGLMKAATINAVVHFIANTPMTPNLFFTRDAITLIARQPLIAFEGVAGQLIGKQTIPDPRCGLIYQLLMWQTGRSIQIEVALAWGIGVTNSQNLGILMG